MNYIKHLNAVFQQFSTDSRLNPTHISLYMALFQFWNINRFPGTFFINREEVMQIAKIGSKVTYHRCLKQLDNWKYIHYMPSHNPFKGSEIEMYIFCTTNETSAETTMGTTIEQVVEQAVIPYINNNKPLENNTKHKLPKNQKEVLIYFESNEWPPKEAKKFFNHYNAIGWKLGGKTKITNWHSAAENWMLKALELKSQLNKKIPQSSDFKQSVTQDNLKITKIKDYGQPL